MSVLDRQVPHGAVWIKPAQGIFVPPQDIEDIVQETYVKVCEYVTQSQVNEPRALNAHGGAQP